MLQIPEQSFEWTSLPYLSGMYFFKDFIGQLERMWNECGQFFVIPAKTGNLDVKTWRVVTSL